MNPTLIVIPTLDPERGGDTGRLARITARCDCRIEVVHDQEGDGFTKTVNRGIELRRPDEDVCLLNDDVDIFHYGWLRTLQNALYVYHDCDYDYGIAGPSGESMSISCAGQLGDEGLKSVNQLPFWCVLIRGAVIDKIGLLDEAFIHYGSDGYYCRIARQNGWQCVWVKSVYLRHEHRGSALQREWRQKDLMTLKQLTRQI